MYGLFTTKLIYEVNQSCGTYTSLIYFLGCHTGFELCLLGFVAVRDAIDREFFL